MKTVDSYHLYRSRGVDYDDYSKIPKEEDDNVNLVGIRYRCDHSDAACPMADSQHHDAEIVTGPHFGCVHFKPKP